MLQKHQQLLEQEQAQQKQLQQAQQQQAQQQQRQQLENAERNEEELARIKNKPKDERSELSCQCISIY